MKSTLFGKKNYTLLKPNLKLNKFIDGKFAFAYKYFKSEQNHKIIDALFFLYLLPNNARNRKGYEKIFTKEIFSEIAKINEMNYLTYKFTLDREKGKIDIFYLFDNFVKFLQENFHSEYHFLRKYGSKSGTEYYVFSDKKFENFIEYRFGKRLPGKVIAINVCHESLKFFKEKYKTDILNKFFTLITILPVLTLLETDNNKEDLIYNDNFFQSVCGISPAKNSKDWAYLKSLLNLEKIPIGREIEKYAESEYLKNVAFGGNYKEYNFSKIKKSTGYFHYMGYTLSSKISVKNIFCDIFKNKVMVSYLAPIYFRGLTIAIYNDRQKIAEQDITPELENHLKELWKTLSARSFNRHSKKGLLIYITNEKAQKVLGKKHRIHFFNANNYEKFKKLYSSLKKHFLENNIILPKTDKSFLEFCFKGTRLDCLFHNSNGFKEESYIKATTKKALIDLTFTTKINKFQKVSSINAGFNISKYTSEKIVVVLNKVRVVQHSGLTLKPTDIRLSHSQ